MSSTKDSTAQLDSAVGDAKKAKAAAEAKSSPEKAGKQANLTAKSTSKDLNATMTTSGPSGTATTGKFGGGKGNLSKREVEQNPFKTLLDISDLIEMEGATAAGGPKETEKEVQNIMLRNNSDLKSWYKLYARKVEA